jgi:hypothetical protein
MGKRALSPCYHEVLETTPGYQYLIALERAGGYSATSASNELGETGMDSESYGEGMGERAGDSEKTPLIMLKWLLCLTTQPCLSTRLYCIEEINCFARRTYGIVLTV